MHLISLEGCALPGPSFNGYQPFVTRKPRFDVEKPEVKSSINLLTELQSEPLQLKLPTLSDSMAALAAARAESEKRF